MGMREALCDSEGAYRRAHQLYKIENIHLTDSIDTENLSTRGRSVWVRSSQVRLLDNSVPHNSLPERMGPLGLGVVRAAALRHFLESGPCSQSSSRPFRAAQTTISCFEAAPSFT